MKYLPTQKIFRAERNELQNEAGSKLNLVSVYFCEAFLMVISLRIYRFHRSLSSFIVVLTAIAVLGKLSSLN